MQYLLFTVLAIAVYFLSDWILQRVELYYNKRFEQRDVVFLFIIAVLAVTSFSLINFIVIN
jgi:hypothetical protein